MKKEINQDLLDNLDKIHSRIFKNYLYNLENDYTVIDFEHFNKFKNSSGEEVIRTAYFSNVQALKVDRWVFDSKEEIIDRFKNIYSAFSNGKENIALLIKRTVEGAEFYFVVKNDSLTGGNRFSTANSIKLLSDSIRGNFPGTMMDLIPMKDLTSRMDMIEDDYFGFDTHKAVSILTNIPSQKSEKSISQGIEKLLDGLAPRNKSEEYTVVFLAEPVSHDNLLSIKNGFEELATSIYKFSEHQVNTGDSQSTAKGENVSASDASGINSSLSKTHGFNVGGNAGISSGSSVGKGWLNGFTNFWSAKSKNMGSNFGLSAGYQKSKTITDGQSYTYTGTRGTNYCITDTSSENITNNYKSFPISNLLKRIDKQIERLEQCEAVGLFKEAIYVFAGDTVMTRNVANYMLGLIQGTESFVESSVVNTWNRSKENKDFDNIRDFVKHFSHPVFLNLTDLKILQYSDHNDSEAGLDLLQSQVESVYPTTYISANELAQIMNFPRKSVQGLSSIECAEFERNLLYKDHKKDSISREKIPFGFVNYMHQIENQEVSLDVNSLTKHTFITGSTGSGKSTAIYKILHELRSKGIPFLVIEPAKGEYRNEFGDFAKVYSTNVRLGMLLKINPFKFPSNGIMVHEHIDRLIEIFNVCWPMYAAMPAVLKEAIERAYEASGWNLNTSQNRIGQIFSADDIGDEKLFNDFTIVDLSRVGSMETKALIMGILVMRLQEYHMANSPSVSELKHVTVLEEAHNLLKRTSSEQSSESSNMLGKSVEMIANAIAEMRTYGEGFIIADQSPGLLDMSVIRNTNTKIILSLPDLSDRELVGKSAGLNDEQIKDIKIQTRYSGGLSE